MNNRCVYILYWSRYYIWSTNNIDRRLKQHHRWHTHSTKRIWDRTLVKVITCKDKEEARSLEMKIKKSWHIDRYVGE